MKKFFGFGSSTPPPPAPPSKPPSLPAKPAAPSSAVAKTDPPSAPATSIIGRWKEASGTGDGSESTEFHTDGSVTERLGGGETIRGRYALAGEKLTIDLAGVQEALGFTVFVEDDTLEMIDGTGQRSTYRRL
ncbi:MAG: DUF5640 domain-containing protein [Chthoniobacterales bacterium]